MPDKEIKKIILDDEEKDILREGANNYNLIQCHVVTIVCCIMANYLVREIAPRLERALQLLPAVASGSIFPYLLPAVFPEKPQFQPGACP